jgi:hypothetical protein
MPICLFALNADSVTVAPPLPLRPLFLMRSGVRHLRIVDQSGLRPRVGKFS